MLSVKHYKQQPPHQNPPPAPGRERTRGGLPSTGPSPASCLRGPPSTPSSFSPPKHFLSPWQRVLEHTGSGERTESLAELGGQLKDKPYRPGAWAQHLTGIPSGPQMGYVASEMSLSPPWACVSSSEKWELQSLDRMPLELRHVSRPCRPTMPRCLWPYFLLEKYFLGPPMVPCSIHQAELGMQKRPRCTQLCLENTRVFKEKGAGFGDRSEILVGPSNWRLWPVTGPLCVSLSSSGVWIPTQRGWCEESTRECMAGIRAARPSPPSHQRTTRASCHFVILNLPPKD